MEQLYMLEIFIDKVAIYAPDEEDNGANKNLIVKTKFGPKNQFILKEGHMAVNPDKKDDIVECDANGKRKWTRTFRVGKSFLFASYADTVLSMLSKFPLEIEIWNDDEHEDDNIFVGVGTMLWDTGFYEYLKESDDPRKLHEPLSIKSNMIVWAECCCKKGGEVDFILRISPLGETVTTEFQQLMTNPDKFCFRTNRAPNMFQCQRIEGDDPNFTMVGSLYETTTLEDPDVIANANKKIEVCTELQSCPFNPNSADRSCTHENREGPEKTYPVEKMRMGDIKGPCGNSNCPLAHKVRHYIRNLPAYKKQVGDKSLGTKGKTTGKVCGSCDCKDDRYHRPECLENKEEATEDNVCKDCGRVTKTGHTCGGNTAEVSGAAAPGESQGQTPSCTPGQSQGQTPGVSQGSTPGTSQGPSPVASQGQTPTGGSVQHIHYVHSTSRPVDLMQSLFGKDFTVANVSTKCKCEFGQNQATNSQGVRQSVCGCNNAAGLKVQVKNAGSVPCIGAPDNKQSTRSLGINNPFVYNVEMKETGKRRYSVYNCTEMAEDKDCKCNPPKPSPPCKTFDCDCLTENMNIAARKIHKPYCPSYKHKSTCPVTMMNDEEEKKDEDEDEAEPLPYGLPPIQLGPCPVLGRPCTVPDGFARMYKTGALPALPPSYNEAGKVCCSREYERIKKAIKEYMKNEKDNDFRCINKFNVDTEKRCCDKEQVLLSLMGKACCGSHKISIQDKYSEKN